MFFRNYSTYEGEGARLYRSPDAIRRDITDIRTKIETINLKLNVRSVLAGMIDEYISEDPVKWIPMLADAVENAERSLESLKSLRKTLDLLGEELEDTKWALGI